MLDGNLVSAQVVVARNGHIALGHGMDHCPCGGTIVHTIVNLALARNRVDTGTEGTGNTQVFQRVAEPIKDQCISRFGIVGVVGALGVFILVTERLVMPHIPSVKFGVNNLAAHPDGILVVGIFQKHAELVPRTCQRERHLALEHATHNSHHTARNTHLEEDTVQSAIFFEHALVKGLFLDYRFFNELIGKAGVRLAYQVDGYGVGRVAETLYPVSRVYGNIKDFTDAELEFYAVLHGGVNAAQVFFAVAYLGLEPCEQVEGALPCADCVPNDADIFDKSLRASNLGI